MPNPSDNLSSTQIAIAQLSKGIAWCLAWGNEATPQYPIETFQSWRSTISSGQLPDAPEWKQALQQANALTQLVTGDTITLADISALIAQHPILWESPIGLVYGGVTKVKSYVFESADLQEIRGASALLDRINLVDLPALFHAESASVEGNFELCQKAPKYCEAVRRDTFLPNNEAGSGETGSLVTEALIPELIVYSTGGNLLAFCPAAFTDELCNAIEKRYTTETLTANSCAVGATFKPVEVYCGLLSDPIENTLWNDDIATKLKGNVALQAYFGVGANPSPQLVKEAFTSRKNFGELVGKLTSRFNQRRSGDDSPLKPVRESASLQNRPSRRYPPMFETHPYLIRDDSDIRSATVQIKADILPDAPKFSEPTARKRRVGQITKREKANKNWYKTSGFEAHWNPTPTDEKVFQSWVSKFETFLKDNQTINKYDPERQIFDVQGNIQDAYKREARSLHEIGASSSGYVAYIYADGNSMGKYIRNKIKTPAQYQEFSQDIFEATEQSVYCAIAKHLRPQQYKPDAKSSRENKDPVWIHPFEIITIGGDDVLLVVPANKAVEIAQTIGESFEELLLKKGGKYTGRPLSSTEQKKQVHRYLPAAAPDSSCELSTSSGVLITAADTPIYYADKLVSQLLKSAKKRLKTLKKKGYHGGTVDFLVLKAVTMITSDIEAFRKEGLTISPDKREHILKLHAAPYTLHELGGLIETVRALKQSKFPKSQLYQIRSLLERGKRTAILNYRYFRVRLDADKRQLIEDAFEKAWCEAQTNGGNLAPWLTPHTDDPKDNQPSPKKKPDNKTEKKNKTVYETIWRELIELEPFITENAAPAANSAAPAVPNQPTGQSISQFTEGAK